jgi:cephalosporin hydroxylase
MIKSNTINDFHNIYYNSRVWENTFYFGNQILKCPLDMWIYQEIIFELRPKILIETGTFMGGSALYYAHLFDIIGDGIVVTIDVLGRNGRPNHPRITYVDADSANPELPKIIQEASNMKEFSLIILDSDHSEEHVSKELAVWSPHVSVGGYIVVEDTNVNGHPARPDHGPGPMEAVCDFLESNLNFKNDANREKFMMTQNPNGWLRRYY